MPVKKAKHEVPDASAALRRERLFVRIGRPAHIGWIFGPAGSGKTTLVASYLAAAPDRLALWYRCDARDIDPATFFAGLSELMAGLLGPDAAPAAMVPEDLVALDYYARAYFERVFDALAARTVIVLDDAHEVQADPSWQLLWSILGAAVPSHVALIVSSREPPPEAFARLQVHGDLDLVTPADLRLDRDEIANLAGQSPDSALVTRVLERTHGWAAGVRLLLRLAAEDGSLAPARDEPLHAYFRRELLATLSTGDRALLTAVAPLTQIDPAIATALTGDPDAAARLERLALTGAFVERYPPAAASDDPGASYRVHALLREALLAERARAAPPTILAADAERIAELLAAAGQLAHAVEVSLAHGDRTLATRELHALGPELLARGRARELIDLLAHLDPAVVAADPELAHAHGRALATLYDPACVPVLESAFELHLATGDATGTYAAFCDWVMAAAGLLFDVAPLDRALAAAELLDQRLPPPADDALAFRYDLALFTALHFRRSPDRRLEPLAERIVATGLAQSPFARADAAALVATYHLMGGRPADAEHTLQRLVVAESTLSPRLRALTRYARVYLAWIRGDRPAFLREQALWHAVIDETGLVPMHPLRTIITAIDHLTRGPPGDAPAELLQPLAAIDALPPLMRVFLSLVRTWSEIARGRLVDARARLALATRLNELVTLDGNSRLIELAGALLDAAEGRDADALDATVRARDRLVDMRVHYHEVAARYLEAWIRLRSGDRSGLAPAFRFARERGIVNVWLLSQPQLATLCAEALADGIEPLFVENLIAARALPPPAPLAALGRWPARVRVRCLGALELVRDDQPLAHARRAPQRPFELMVAIVAFGGRAVPIHQLEDALWPNAEGDSAHRAFKVTLHRLRSLIEVDDAIVVTQHTVSLDPYLVWVDVAALEHLAQAVSNGRLDPIDARARLAELDRGALAPALADAPWILEPRRRIAELVASITR